MSVAAMIGHLLLERLSRRVLPRIPETALVMEAPGQIQAFQAGGRDDGILTHIYFFHTVMSLPVIRPGDTVIDLACGPANQLAQIARLNPDTQFIGIDASPNMLELARATLTSNRIDNVTLRTGDITDPLDIDTGSIDCITCTMSLHHLPNTAALHKTMREIRRILKPGAGVYFADFGRLKRGATQKHFAYDRIELQSEQFTEDFLNSMQAAFSLDELSAAIQEIGAPIENFQTALAPFMTIFRSAARRSIDAELEATIKSLYENLTARQKRDFNNMARWFRLGGLRQPCKI
jgi:ubiquinone/menaquinone biosynthesis C-methylase UbiE